MLKQFFAKNSDKKGTKHFEIYAVNNQGLQGDATTVTSLLLALGRLTSALPHFRDTRGAAPSCSVQLSPAPPSALLFT